MLSASFSALDWFTDDPRRGEIALTVLALATTAGIAWCGRKHLWLSLPVALLILLLAAIAIPSAVPARAAAQRAACQMNLRLIREAKTQWARDQQKTSLDTPTEADLFGTNSTSGRPTAGPVCPRGGHYTIGSMGQNPACSLEQRGHRLD